MKAITCVKVLAALLAASAGLATAQAPPPAPSWWLDRGAVTAGASNDFAVANTGQARHFVQQALREATLRMPRMLSRSEYAFYNSVLTPGAPGINDFAALTTGELRSLLGPLHADWGGRVPLQANVFNIVANDFSPVNLGQLKTANFFSYYGAPLVVGGFPVISEVRTGAAGFVEIANLGAVAVPSLSDWYVVLDPEYRAGKRPKTLGGFSIPSGALAPGARIQVTPGTLLANYVPPDNTLANALRIVEIMYHPKGSDTLEYVVLRNFGTAVLDISGVRFQGLNVGGAGGPDFTFPANQVMQPASNVVLTNNPNTFRQRFPDFPFFEVVDWLNPGLLPLSDGGETVQISTPMPGAVVIQAIAYDDVPPWPTSADGEGASLAVLNPAVAGGGANWIGVLGGNPLRAPLTLSTSGQYLALFFDDDTRIQEFMPALPVTDQAATASFNLDDNPNSTTSKMEWRFAASTPGAANIASTIGAAGPPAITVTGGGTAVDNAGRGIIATSGNVSISIAHPRNGTGGADLRYTTDGTNPVSSGTAQTYTGSISRNVTTVLRAVLRIPVTGGFAFSDPAYATFIFADNVPNQTWPAGAGTSVSGFDIDFQIDPDMPAARLPDFKAGLTNATTASLFLTLNPENLVDDDFIPETLGLFTAGPPVPVPAHLEFYDPSNSSRNLSAPVTLEISGDATLWWGSTRKKSMKIAFGPTEDNGVAADFFGDGLSYVAELVIKGGGHDSWHVTVNEQFYENAGYVTDQMVSATFRAMKDTFLPGQNPDPNRWAQPRTRTVHVYINGLYWGVYSMFDRGSSSWAATLTDRPNDDFDTQSDGFNPGFSLFDLSGTNLEGYIDYMLSGLFLGSADWPYNNIRWVWEKNPALANLQFFHSGMEFYAMELDWDLPGEAPLGTPSRAGNIGNGVPVDRGGPMGLMITSANDPVFRNLMLERLLANCYGTAPLSPDGLMARFNSLTDAFAPLAICESARWGDGYSTNPADVAYGPASTDPEKADQWDTATTRCRRFIQVFPQQCFESLRALYQFSLAELPAYPSP